MLDLSQEPDRPVADPVTYLSRRTPALPVHFFAPRVLRDRLAAFLRGFPGLVTYAVKANPSEAVLAELCAGSIGGFDVASPAEIAQIARTCPGAPMHYNNPVRSAAEIREGVAGAVASWAVDDAGELAKLAALVPRTAEVAVRFKLPVGGAHYDFGSKFGATEGAAADLLSRVAAEGFRPALTFHVGTQCTDPAAWTTYVAAAARIARAAGVAPERLNVGGGFPAARDGGTLDLAPYFAAIRQGLDAFALPPALVCEPGRGLVADAFAYAVEVKSVRDGQVYLADGIYGGLSEFGNIALPRTRVIAPDGRKRQGRDLPRIVFGPTCDSLDRLPGTVPLPANLAEGDWLLFDGMGAYLTGVTTRFNGYGAHETVTVDRL